MSSVNCRRQGRGRRDRQQGKQSPGPLATGKGATPTGLQSTPSITTVFGCGNQKMYVLDTESGKVLAAVPVGNGGGRRGL